MRIPPNVENAIFEARRRDDAGSEFGVGNGPRPLPRPRTFDHTPGEVMRGSRPSLVSRSPDADSATGGAAPGRTPSSPPRVPVAKGEMPRPFED